MQLDLIDEFRLSLHPDVAGEGTRLFDDVPKSYRLDLVSSTASKSGIVELQYRRHREPSSPVSKEAVMALPEVVSSGSRCWPRLSDCDAGH